MLTAFLIASSKSVASQKQRNASGTVVVELVHRADDVAYDRAWHVLPGLLETIQALPQSAESPPHCALPRVVSPVSGVFPSPAHR